eukprot:Seg2016.3 transcript_id=Seg2016.3/GoldUCD/mRNA.D3Y31 product="hypothetical protein" protein_id=Seg2016.3/GoldUCD/D3Y31
MQEMMMMMMTLTFMKTRLTSPTDDQMQGKYEKTALLQGVCTYRCQIGGEIEGTDEKDQDGVHLAGGEETGEEGKTGTETHWD